LSSWIGAGGNARVDQNATTTNLNLTTFKRKVSDNTIQVNNGSIATNTNSVAISQSTIFIFLASTLGASNGLFNSGVISIIEDNTTQKTAMYNYIKSINNSAF
jgi:hypothetical protein